MTTAVLNVLFTAKGLIEFATVAGFVVFTTAFASAVAAPAWTGGDAMVVIAMSNNV
ncbi:hypothetical protein [Glaciecola sp. 1036]|uniref:hypothetical protein n=1 Tax=Alteromonadaceae TaxID=72275 RepID=UPI003D02782B